MSQFFPRKFVTFVSKKVPIGKLSKASTTRPDSHFWYVSGKMALTTQTFHTTRHHGMRLSLSKGVCLDGSSFLSTDILRN